MFARKSFHVPAFSGTSSSFIIRGSARSMASAQRTSRISESDKEYARMNAYTQSPSDPKYSKAHSHNPNKHQIVTTKRDKLGLSPSFFTGRPLLHDTMYQLSQLIRQHQGSEQHFMLSDSFAGNGEHNENKWISLRTLEAAWKMKITQDEYTLLTSRLNQLDLIKHQQQKSDDSSMSAGLEDVKKILDKFSVPTSQSNQSLHSSSTVDEWGRAFALGYKRRTRAQVYLTPALEQGEGRIFINGRDFVNVLERFVDRARVIRPFEVTDTMGMYNAWCIVDSFAPNQSRERMNEKDGIISSKNDSNAMLDQTLPRELLGPSTTSASVANGIANALLVFNAQYRQVLDDIDMLKPDPRQRERKKPGQPGARAKFQWVKR